MAQTFTKVNRLVYIKDLAKYRSNENFLVVAGWVSTQYLFYLAILSLT